MKRILWHKKNLGLSLVEVTIAIAMISIILGIVIGISSQGYQYLRKARMQTMGMFLAQEGVEHVFRDGIDTSYVPQTRGAVAGFSGSNDLDFYRRIIVSNTALLPAAAYTNRLYRIQVRVDWNSNNDEFILMTYKANY